MLLWQVLAAVAIAWFSGALFGLGLNAPLSAWARRQGAPPSGPPPLPRAASQPKTDGGRQDRPPPWKEAARSPVSEAHADPRTSSLRPQPEDQEVEPQVLASSYVIDDVPPEMEALFEPAPQGQTLAEEPPASRSAAELSAPSTPPIDESFDRPDKPPLFDKPELEVESAKTDVDQGDVSLSHAPLVETSDHEPETSARREAPPAAAAEAASPRIFRTHFALEEPLAPAGPEVITQVLSPSSRADMLEPRAKVLDEGAFRTFNERLNEKAGFALPLVGKKKGRKERRVHGRLRRWIEIILACLLLGGAAWGSYYVAMSLRPVTQQIW